MKQSSRQSGFTLVELAIVLVIIGLIIGGVLAGQDLIKAATIKSQVTQIQEISTSATAFRTKYNGLPGDLISSTATQYNLTTGDGTAGKSDGNGAIEGCTAGSTVLSCETGLFFYQLSQARLLAGNYTAVGTGSAAFATALTAATINTYIPRAKLRNSGSLVVYSVSGLNYVGLAGFVTDTSSVVTGSNAVTPQEARSIDEKMDDAVPLSGIVTALSSGAWTAGAAPTAEPVPATAATTECLTTATSPGVYNVTTAATGGQNNLNCMLQIRTEF